MITHNVECLNVLEKQFRDSLLVPWFGFLIYFSKSSKDCMTNDVKYCMPITVSMAPSILLLIRNADWESDGFLFLFLLNHSTAAFLCNFSLFILLQPCPALFLSVYYKRVCAYLALSIANNDQTNNEVGAKLHSFDFVAAKSEKVVFNQHSTLLLDLNLFWWCRHAKLKLNFAKKQANITEKP